MQAVKRRRIDDQDTIMADQGAYSHLYVTDREAVKPPYLDGSQYLVNGEIRTWTGKSSKVYSPILDGNGEKIEIGTYPFLTSKEALEAMDAATHAFNKGVGPWALSGPRERIKCVEKFLQGLQEIKSEIVKLLMWEICKTEADATKEVDRTIAYIVDTIKALKSIENGSSQFEIDSGIVAQIRRVPLGVVLCVGPFNYPFNETYTTLFPALLMGNTVILKTPRTGCMCHIPTLKLFQECFPPGVINVIHGAGREVLPPLMDHGGVQVFAFIGTSKAAVELQRVRPSPHRLRVCLGLDAKNPAIILPDADLDLTVKECVLGSLSYNGQRCTALKILYVHESIADEFARRFSEAVDKLVVGLPWHKGTNITPLPEPNKPDFIRELTKDAISKGARIVNANGGKADKTFVAPTVLYPVTDDMRVAHEEQFGPLVPISVYKDEHEVIQRVIQSSFGQQTSVFSQNPERLAPLLDIMVNQVSRVNINCQCQRGPDSLPFTGRKNSACGTLSIVDALRVMSIRSVIATKENGSSTDLINNIMISRKSQYLRSEFLF
eukprot:Colp12_sorted_trinity150504_noHs@10063